MRSLDFIIFRNIILMHEFKKNYNDVFLVDDIYQCIVIWLFSTDFCMNSRNASFHR